jgi:hypothetical protein
MSDDSYLFALKGIEASPCDVKDHWADTRFTEVTNHGQCMSSNIPGIPPTDPDRGNRDPGNKRKHDPKKVEATVKPLLREKDEYLPTKASDLVCEVINYGNDPKLRQIIWHHQKRPQALPPPPPSKHPGLASDMEFEEI